MILMDSFCYHSVITTVRLNSISKRYFLLYFKWAWHRVYSLNLVKWIPSTKQEHWDVRYQLDPPLRKNFIPFFEWNKS